jgi:protein gp37
MVVALENVWLGVSVESRVNIDRIDQLRGIPAAVKFLSLEPLLGRLSNINLSGIDWVIAGCESGQHARPAEVDWFRSLRDQCQVAGIPFFLKQMMVDGKKAEMPELDGRVWAEYPAGQT